MSATKYTHNRLLIYRNIVSLVSDFGTEGLPFHDLILNLLFP